jgi:4-amino-4-deoxy-L-arabinose transferase-like glycosyltransferase
VTQIDNFATDSHSTSPVARFAWIVLIIATLYISYFHNLGAFGLVGPDEPRYAWIARDMAESGDWVTPRLYGKPWFEKPVLYYWSAALSFKLFGVSETTARVPSALAALLATLAMAWLAWRVYGAETSRWVLLLLPTTVGMIGFSHAAATDMFFAATLTIAIVFAAGLLRVVPQVSPSSFTSSTSFTSFFMGFFVGLAVLAKGPAAIILSGGAILLWAAFTKRWRDAIRCLHPVAIAGFCLTALPWYSLCGRRNPDFFRIFIIEHNFKRYLTPEFQHVQPFWFYIPVVLIAFVPWTLVMLWSIAQSSFASIWKRRASSVAFFFLAYAVFCLVFFSASQSKLPGYILPAIPALGFLLARSYAVISNQSEKALRWLLSGFAILALPIALLLIGFGRHFRTSRTNTGLFLAVGCVLLAFALANLLLTVKDHIKGFAIAPTAVLPVLFLLLVFHYISRPWLRYDPSGKTLATEISAAQIPQDQLSVAAMKRGQQYSLSFYLHREVPVWNPDEPKPGVLLVPSRGCTTLVQPPLVCGRDPITLKNSGWFAYRVERSNLVGGRSGFGDLGSRGSDSGSSHHGEPR